MLVAACGGAAPVARPPAPSAYVGRVGLTGESWTDVVIDGTDPAAHELCDVFLAGELRVQSKLEGSRVYTRACALEPLAAVRPTLPYLLVDTVPVDQDTVRVELLIAGRKDPLAPAHGHRTAHVPMNDRATCELMKKHLDADDADSHAALVTAIADVLAQQAAQTKQREQEACDRLHTDEQGCANLPPEAATACLGAFVDERAACDTAKQQRAIVEQKQSAPPPAAQISTRSCEPVRR